MLRLPRKALGTLALIALVMHAGLSLPALRQPSIGDSLGVQLAFYLALALRNPALTDQLLAPTGQLLLAALLLLTGRLILSFLPPGPTGSHAARDLPLTWAVSHLLGQAAWFLETSLLAPDPARLEQGGRTLSSVVLFLPWVLLAAARLVTLPGAMVPRHAPRSERSGLARVLLLVVLMGLGVVLLARGMSLWQGLGWLATWIVLGHGLAQARRAPLGRTLLLLGSAVTLAPFAFGSETLWTGTYFALGTAFLVPWLRRADRQACWISALAFASCAIVLARPLLALAGILVLVAASGRAQRPSALGAAAVGAAVAALSLLVDRGAGMEPHWILLRPIELAREALTLSRWGLAWPAVALAGLGWIWRTMRGPAERWKPGTIEEPRRESAALVLLLVLGLVALSRSADQWPEREALVVLLPAALLFTGLVMIPSERPGPVPSER